MKTRLEMEARHEWIRDLCNMKLVYRKLVGTNGLREFSGY
jgi:hypothetical protein